MATSLNTSIKTRIETGPRRGHRGCGRPPLSTLPLKQGLKRDPAETRVHVRAPLSTLPLKQGLKLWSAFGTFHFAIPLSTLPLKQGLKLHPVNWFAACSHSSLNTSIKTRIETSYAMIGQYRTSQPSLNTSIKTRIETQAFVMGYSNRAKASLNTSIKTRIETHPSFSHSQGDDSLSQHFH